MMAHCENYAWCANDAMSMNSRFCNVCSKAFLKGMDEGMAIKEIMITKEIDKTNIFSSKIKLKISKLLGLNILLSNPMTDKKTEELK